MRKKVTVNDQSFTNLFPEINYDSNEITNSILDIWNNLRLFTFPKDSERAMFSYYRVESNDTLYSISRDFYNTIEYWWLIPLMNDIEDPFTFLDDVRNNISQDNPKRIIKILKKKYLSNITNSIIVIKNINEEINKNRYLAGDN